jgi:hypothetical protein
LTLDRVQQRDGLMDREDSFFWTSSKSCLEGKLVIQPEAVDPGQSPADGLMDREDSFFWTSSKSCLEGKLVIQPEAVDPGQSPADGLMERKEKKTKPMLDRKQFEELLVCKKV